MTQSIEDFDVYFNLDQNEEDIKAVKLSFSIFGSEATTDKFYIDAVFIDENNKSIPRSKAPNEMMEKIGNHLVDLLAIMLPGQKISIQDDGAAPLIVKLSEKMAPIDLDDALQAGVTRALSRTMQTLAKIDNLSLIVQQPNPFAEKILLNSFEYRKSAIHKALTSAFGDFATTEKIDDLTNVLAGLSRLYMHTHTKRIQILSNLLFPKF